MLLAMVPWIAFLRWRQNPKHLLPLFALISRDVLALFRSGHVLGRHAIHHFRI